VVVGWKLADMTSPDALLELLTELTTADVETELIEFVAFKVVNTFVADRDAPSMAMLVAAVDELEVDETMLVALELKACLFWAVQEPALILLLLIEEGVTSCLLEGRPNAKGAMSRADAKPNNMVDSNLVALD